MPDDQKLSDTQLLRKAEALLRRIYRREYHLADPPARPFSLVEKEALRVLNLIEGSKEDAMTLGAGDEHMGDFVYCTQHCRVHSTGRCTVMPARKISLIGDTPEKAEEHWDQLRTDIKHSCRFKDR